MTWMQNHQKAFTPIVNQTQKAPLGLAASLFTKNPRKGEGVQRPCTHGLDTLRWKARSLLRCRAGSPLRYRAGSPLRCRAGSLLRCRAGSPHSPYPRDYQWGGWKEAMWFRGHFSIETPWNPGSLSFNVFLATEFSGMTSSLSINYAIEFLTAWYSRLSNVWISHRFTTNLLNSHVLIFWGLYCVRVTFFMLKHKLLSNYFNIFFQ